MTIGKGYALFQGSDLASVTSQSTDPTATTDGNAAFKPGDIIFNSTNGRVWICVASTPGAAQWALAVVPGVGIEPSNNLEQFGASTGTMLSEGNVSRQVPGVTAGIQPGATGADNVLFAYTMPASAFDAAGRGITVTCAGNFGATGNNKRCKLIFNPATAVVGATVGAGGITISDTGVVAQNGGAWALNGSLFKRGALNSNTQVAVPGGVQLSASHVGLTAAVQEVVAVENAAILVAVTGNATTAASDIIGSFFEVNAMN